MNIEQILDSDENLDQYPLLGVPFTCKELIGVKGIWTDRNFEIIIDNTNLFML